MRVLLVGAVLLAGCGAPSTSPSDDLAVSAAVAPAAVRASDTVTVRVAVTNRGRQPRTINVGVCIPPFVVTDQRGAVAGPTPATLCSASLSLKDLAPGEEFVFTLPWRAVVVPGVYALRGRVFAQGGVAESRPASVSVTP